MADSSLVTVECLTSTKCNKNRIYVVKKNGKIVSQTQYYIDTITIHCTAGDKNKPAIATVQYWTNSNVGASAQYVVGGDGSVCQNVLEADRAWTTGGMSAEKMKRKGRNYETGSLNDYHAVTIEVASNKSGTEITETAYNKLVDLVVDICQRNGKTKALWFGDNATKMVNYVPAANEMKFTWHRWFAQKACPGQAIMNRFQQLIDTVNTRLAGQPQPQPTPTPTPTPQPTNAETYMWNAFKYLGDCGCAGLLANLRCESAYRANNLQNSFEKKFGMDDETYTAAVDAGAWDFVNDHAGYGLAQWTYYSRKQNLLNYAKAMNVSIGNLDMQIAFCKQELDGYKLTDRLKKCTSAKEASDLVCKTYEKPADQSEAALKRRSDIAEEIYATYHKQPIPETHLYRVRLSWTDVNSQIGAYKVYDNAVKACNEHPGYSVYDENGNRLYTSAKDELYRVRLTWEDSKSQVGAYKVYDNAVAECNRHPGYSVYDSTGTCLYTSKKSNEEVAKEVIQGKWGNGQERKDRLTKAGYDYNTVQSIVNKMLNK